MSSSEWGLQQCQLSYTYTWLEGKNFNIFFQSLPTNHVQHSGNLGAFTCRCGTSLLSSTPLMDRLRGRVERSADDRLRHVECPVHSPSTSKEIRDALERTAKRLVEARTRATAPNIRRGDDSAVPTRLTGSARELFIEQMKVSGKHPDSSEEKVPSGPTAPPDPPAEQRDNPYAWLELE